MMILQLGMKAAFCVMVICPGVTAQTKAPDGNEILRRCAQSLEGIEDYTVDLTAEMDMDRVRIPQMRAVMYYKAPDKIHFESPNFAMLPREGFALPVKELAHRYDAAVRGEEVLEGKKTIKLLLVAKEPATRVQQLLAWIDPENMTIVKTETVPYRGRSVSVRLAYALQEQRYWLPVSLKARFEVVGGDTTTGSEFQIPSAPQMEEFRRPPRSGSMSIEYSNYRINTGLSDEMFKRQMKE